MVVVFLEMVILVVAKLVVVGYFFVPTYFPKGLSRLSTHIFLVRGMRLMALKYHIESEDPIMVATVAADVFVAWVWELAW